MLDAEKRKRFVELRGRGMSYVKISAEIGVCKNTLVKWSKEYTLEINNAKAMELEGIREEYLLGREHRVRVNGTQLNQITEELLKRDLSEVGTYRLFEMQRKLVQEIKEDSGEMVFSKETRKDGFDSLKDIFKKTEKWTG